MFDSATPGIAAHRASLSITVSQSLFKLLSIEWMMLCSHLILCHPPPLLPLILGVFWYKEGSWATGCYVRPAQPTAQREANRRPGSLSMGEVSVPLSLPYGEHFLHTIPLGPHSYHREQFVPMFLSGCYRVKHWSPCSDRISDGIYHPIHSILGFPGGSAVKNLPANAGEAGSIPDPGRCPGEGNGSPL